MNSSSIAQMLRIKTQCAYTGHSQDRKHYTMNSNSHRKLNYLCKNDCRNIYVYKRNYKKSQSMNIKSLASSACMYIC